jgi:hypothetical protein
MFRRAGFTSRLVVGKRVGTRPLLDAAAIGQAAVSVVTNPEQWQEWGAVDVAPQH